MIQKRKTFVSPTYGKISIEDVAEKILQYYQKMRVRYGGCPIHITVGTDSQNFDYTKTVVVICVTCEGHGGIFFYQVLQMARISDVRRKLHMETELSLETAEAILSIFEKEEKYEFLVAYCSFSIHIDAGNDDAGKTKQLIPELVGWVRACGYDCAIKPDSYAASSVADKISK